MQGVVKKSILIFGNTASWKIISVKQDVEISPVLAGRTEKKSGTGMTGFGPYFKTVNLKPVFTIKEPPAFIFIDFTVAFEFNCG